MPLKNKHMYSPMGDSLSDDSDSDVSKPKRTKSDKVNDEYQARRERNNIAVRKSREKSRAKAKETQQQVNKLRAENEVLEQKVQLLTKELSVLKDLFLAHAGSSMPDNNIESPTVEYVNVEVATPTDHQYSASHPDM